MRERVEKERRGDEASRRGSEGGCGAGRMEDEGGRNKGDGTVGVCNCSGFNALLMADGTPGPG